jgi:hypothetical protein
MEPFPVAESSELTCNSCNHLEFAPYYFDPSRNSIVIEPKFHKYAIPKTIELLRAQADAIGCVLEYSKEKQPKPRTIGKHKVLASPAELIYRSYLFQFNFDAYADELRPVLPPHRIHELSSEEVRLLAEWTWTFCDIKKPHSADTLKMNVPLLWKFIEDSFKELNPTKNQEKEEEEEEEEGSSFWTKSKALLSYYWKNLREKKGGEVKQEEEIEEQGQGQGLFIRLGTTSGKNFKRPLATHSTFEVFCELCSNRQLLKEYDDKLSGRIYTPLALVLMPWNSRINSKREWRVYLKKGKITGVSQQNWFETVGHTIESVTLASKAIEKLVLEEVVPISPFKSMVLDVWFDEEQDRAFLIECNPWGAWGASGSSLFHWLEDRDKLEGVTTPQIRFRT